MNDAADEDLQHELLIAALDYAQRGLPVLPCKPTDKKPYVARDKDENGEPIPKTGGLYKATCDPDQIRAWWAEWPHAMIGVRTGAASGLFVVDADVDDGINGHETLAALGIDELETCTVLTPRGGLHLHYRYQDGLRNSAGDIGPGVDVRGEGGYIIVPPSMRADGRRYEWRQDGATQPAEIPPAIIAALKKKPERADVGQRQSRPSTRSDDGEHGAYVAAALNGECDRVANAREGARNDALNTAAFSLGQLVAGAGLDENLVRDRLFNATVARLANDDGRQSVLATIESGLNAGRQQPRTTAPAIERLVVRGHDRGDQPKPQQRDPAGQWLWKWHGEVATADSRRWCVQDLIPETGCGLISGQWGTYKTFVALDLAGAVMSGTDFINFSVRRKGGVLFIACEGQNEVAIRLNAVVEARCAGLERAPFAWIDSCPRLLDPNAGKTVAAMVRQAADKMMRDFNLPVSLIIIDTAGKAAGYAKAGDENDPALGKILLKTLGDLSRATGAFVLGVDHFGKDATVGTRGASSKEDDADVVLACLGERTVAGAVTNMRLALRKRRSGSNGEEFSFHTKIALMGVDQNDAKITTLLIEWDRQTDAAATVPKGDAWERTAKSAKLLRKVLINLTIDHGRDIKPWNDGPRVRAVDCDIVRAEFYASYVAEGATEKQKAAARQKAFKRAMDAAQTRELIGYRKIGTTESVWLAAAVKLGEGNREDEDE